MYKSGQVVYDTAINEPVIFIEGDGEEYKVVCSGVKNDVATSQAVDIIPIWNKDNKVVVGKYAAKNFANILGVNKNTYKKYADYIELIKPETSLDGNREEQKYHIKGQ